MAMHAAPRENLEPPAEHHQGSRRGQNPDLVAVQEGVNWLQRLRQQGRARRRPRNRRREHGQRRQPAAQRVQAHDRRMSQMGPFARLRAVML